VTRAALVAALALLTGCATPHAFDLDDVEARAAHREAVAEWCELVGPCTDGMPPAGALPVYSEACGYLPPLLGDDC